MSDKKVGFLSKNKAKGSTYIYLRKSEREGKTVRKENIYSFGRMPGALEKMFEWRNDFDKFPIELKEKGYDFEDLNEWILTLETKVTSRGKEFKI